MKYFKIGADLIVVKDNRLYLYVNATGDMLAFNNIDEAKIPNDWKLRFKQAISQIEKKLISIN